MDRLRFSLAGSPSLPSQRNQLRALRSSLIAASKTLPQSRELMDLEDRLSRVDTTGLPGFKAWIYQYSILPRILWPLLVYTIPITTVKGMEKKISSSLQRWLGLPRSLSSSALYGTSNILQLPISSLTKEFMVSRTQEALQYRDSRDPKVVSASIQVRTGRKWSAGKALD